MQRCLLLLVLFLSVGFTLPAQTFTMKGTVYDETGATMPGVSVYLKNKINIGTTTNSEGKFTIKADKNDVIVFSFVGYKNVEQLITKEDQNMEVRFTAEAEALEEVVVSALGQQQRKISSLAAVSSVDVGELQAPVASVANLLGGRVAGVISMQTSGEPGKNISEFWVRGIGTFGANASALVLIDGLEGDINSIDAADIESFSILKDASATAVYGVRGANGVVLITTKRGTSDKVRITGRVNYTLSHLTHVPEYLRAYEYAKLVNEASVVRGETPVYDAAEMNIIQDGTDLDIYPDVSWQDEVLKRNSFKQGYYLSAQGGADIAKFFISLGGSKDDAAYKYDKNNVYGANVGYNTYSYRANLDLKLTKSTNLYFGTDGFLSITNSPGVASTDYIWQAQATLNPLFLPTRYSNGQLPAASGAGAETVPTVMINNLGRRSDQKYQGKITMAVNQDLSAILDGLKIRAQGAYDIESYFNEMRLLMPDLYQAMGRDAEGRLVTIQRVVASSASYGRSTDQYRKYHFESTLNYDKVFGDAHRVSALVYYYMSDQKKASDAQNNMSAIPVRYQGLSSRLTYGFRDTYMIDVNFGYTGSENFQPGRQYGFFPSLALGWVPSSYQWVKDNLKWLSFFKIRGSYGSVGNDRITNRRFPYLTTMSQNSLTSAWGTLGVLSVTESVIGADNLQWEKATKADLGIEGRFLKDRLQFVVDFFNDKRSGIFMQRVQVPGYAGLVSLPYGNVGQMTSFGSDGNVSYMHEISKDMSFTVRGNFTYSRNNVQDWEEANPKYPYMEQAGYPNGSIRGYRSLGLFKDKNDIETSPIQTFGTVMPGDIKYRDINGDGQINSDDVVPLSYSTYPLLMYGFGGEFKYKNLTLGVLFKGTGKTDFFKVGYYIDGVANGTGYVPFFNGQRGNVLSMAADPANRWIPKDYAAANGIDPSLAENPNARFPRLQYGHNNNNSQLSDFWKGNSSYLRLQEITLNYNWQNDAFRKVGISSVDVQFVGSNLAVWSNVDVFDPEQANRNGNVYPIPATFTLQLYINL